MAAERLLRLAVKSAGLGVVGLVLVAVSACHNSSPPQSASQSQAASAAAPASKSTAIVGTPEKGKELFAENCTTCHGMQGQGVVHLGADLQTSKFVANSTEAQLVAFIEQGRSANDPMNEMHVAMPPKGGNPALTTQDLYDIVAFIRQIQRTHAPGN